MGPVSGSTGGEDCSVTGPVLPDSWGAAGAGVVVLVLVLLVVVEVALDRLEDAQPLTDEAGGQLPQPVGAFEHVDVGVGQRLLGPRR
jgi:hypothetical protein